MVDHYTGPFNHNVESINHILYMMSSGRYAHPITYNLILLLIIDASDVCVSERSLLYNATLLSHM